MAEQTDILVVGGGPAAMVSALTARKYYPHKKILLMKKVKDGCIPCGIPYMFSSLKDPDDNKMSDAGLRKNNIDMVIEEAVKINREQKQIVTANGRQYGYEKLILAVGSSPIMLPIPGIDKKGVYPVYKDMAYLKDAIPEIKKTRNILILGGGFIGVEFADEISKIDGLKVSLVEMMPQLLANSFDSEFSQIVEEKLRKRNITILTNTRVEEIEGDANVKKVRLSDGQAVDVDSVILGIGAVSNTKLATEAGLNLGHGEGIWVDEYMRTGDPDIFAVGDCVGKRDFYTRRSIPVMLASTATAEARIAGANLYGLKVIRENKGTIAIYSTYIDGLVLGSAGLTENTAQKEGFEIVTGVAAGVDKHPGTLPGARNLNVKLIFSRKAGVILGGQVSGGVSCGEMINLIGVAIQKRMSAMELETLQMATHPYLTSAPTLYPIVVAAQNALVRM